jgi:hypothetical protein
VLDECCWRAVRSLSKGIFGELIVPEDFGPVQVFANDKISS